MYLYLHLCILDNKVQIKDHWRGERYLKGVGNNGIYNRKVEKETNWEKRENWLKGRNEGLKWGRKQIKTKNYNSCVWRWYDKNQLVCILAWTLNLKLYKRAI